MADNQADMTLTEKARLIQANVERHIERLTAQAQQSLSADVLATPHTQAGREILVGGCPVCGNIAALSGEGKHLCRRCNTWLNYRRK